MVDDPIETEVEKSLILLNCLNALVLENYPDYFSVLLKRLFVMQRFE